MNNITLREYYAGQALQGVYANKDLLVIMTTEAENQNVEPADLIAKRCFQIAESMMTVVNENYSSAPGRRKV